MKTIEQLEQKLEQAKQQNLIVSYEHITNRDYIVVKLHEDCCERTKHELKAHIRSTYRGVGFVTTAGHPNRCFMYIKYNDDCS